MTDVGCHRRTGTKFENLFPFILPHWIFHVRDFGIAVCCGGVMNFYVCPFRWALFFSKPPIKHQKVAAAAAAATAAAAAAAAAATAVLVRRQQSFHI